MFAAEGAGTETMFEQDAIAIYASSDPVPRVADATLELLQAAGWQSQITAKNDQVRHLTFTRVRYRLTAYISVAPGMNNRTSIQYDIAAH